MYICSSSIYVKFTVNIIVTIIIIIMIVIIIITPYTTGGTGHIKFVEMCRTSRRTWAKPAYLEAFADLIQTCLSVCPGNFCSTYSFQFLRYFMKILYAHIF